MEARRPGGLLTTPSPRAAPASDWEVELSDRRPGPPGLIRGGEEDSAGDTLCGPRYFMPCDASPVELRGLSRTVAGAPAGGHQGSG